MELLRLSAHDAALRLSRGEELMESLLQAAELLRLESASVTGLGAASRAEIGVLLGASKAFLPRCSPLSPLHIQFPASNHTMR